VYGRIIDAGTGKTINSVPVIVAGEQIGTISKADGTFAMQGVPGEATRIEFRHPCYFPVFVAVPPDKSVEIEVGLPFDESSLRRPGCGGLGARRKG
jgi:hypothetical protein